MRYLLFLVIISLLTFPAFAAEPVTINFWHAMEGHRGDILNKLIDEFNSQNPDIKVIGKCVGATDYNKDKYNNGYNILFQNLLINISTQTPPDVAQVYENWTSQFITIKALVPVEDFIKTPEGLSDKEIADFVPAFIEANKYDGKIWTLPFNKSIYVLYYNRKIFEEKKLNPPKNWQDLADICEKLTVKDNNGNVTRYGLSFKPDVDTFSLILLSSGGTLINKDGKANFNDLNGEKAINYLKSMVEKNIAITSFNPQKDFTDGKCAILIDTTSKISFFDKGKMNFEYGVAPCPSDNKDGKTLFAGTNLGIFSKDPAKQKASWKFIKWLTSTENTTQWAMETGYLPIRNSAIKSTDFQEFLNKKSQNKVGVEEMGRAVVAPRVAAWQSIRGIIDDTVFNTLVIKEDIKESLNNAVSLANQFLH